MAEIAPLRGILYNEEKIGGMTQVVAPPYDVVTSRQRDAFHASHPNNIMRVDLGAPKPEDSHPHEWHHRAALEFNRWLAEGVMHRDKSPGIYYMETDYDDPASGARKTRHGFICLLRLEEFSQEAKVRPHERTFSAHREERLGHLSHLQAHLSQVFAVFPDQNLGSYEILKTGLQGGPLYDFQDTVGQGHRMWPVYNPEAIAALQRHMSDRTVYIADGHHRYETGLNYRRMKAEQGVYIGPRSPLNYLLVYLCAFEDPGLHILPAHRLIGNTLKDDREAFEASIRRYFTIQAFPFDTGDETSARKDFLGRLESEGRDKTAIGLYTRLARTYYLLTLRDDMETSLALDGWPNGLQKLDTVILTSLIFQETLGMTESDLDDAARIAYRSLPDEAIEQVDKGGKDLAAILNPTRLEQVRDVAEEGLIMPRKSTYFYPKVTTGLVVNPLNPFEEIEAES